MKVPPMPRMCKCITLSFPERAVERLGTDGPLQPRGKRDGVGNGPEQDPHYGLGGRLPGRNRTGADSPDPLRRENVALSAAYQGNRSHDPESGPRRTPGGRPEDGD